MTMQIITDNNNRSFVVEMTDHPVRPILKTTLGTYTVLKVDTLTGEMLVSLHRPYELWGGRTWCRRYGNALVATRGNYCGAIGNVIIND